MYILPGYKLPLSFSQIEAFYTCPIKHNLKYIQKVKVSVKEEVFAKGKFIHSFIEDMARGQQLIQEYVPEEYREEFDYLNKFFSHISPSEHGPGYKIEPEKQVTFAFENVSITGYIDFFAKSNRGRVMLFDWKSGKKPSIFPNYWDQLELYALYTFLKYPEVNQVELMFRYVEKRISESKIVTRKKDFDRIYNQVRQKVVKMVNVIDQNRIKMWFEMNKPKQWQCNFCDYKDICDKKIDKVVDNELQFNF